MGTSKNSPFAIWTNLSPQKFILKKPQYTKYSVFSKTFSVGISSVQIIKKEFLEVAFS